MSHKSPGPASVAVGGQRRLRPVVGPGLRKPLLPVFGLVGLLAANGVYLAGITLTEWLAGDLYQDCFYQPKLLVHLVLGLLLILPLVAFGALHLRNVWHRPNRRAAAAGLSVYSLGLVLLASAIVLTRIGGSEVRGPQVRALAYWLHLLTPRAVIWP